MKKSVTYKAERTLKTDIKIGKKIFFVFLVSMIFSFSLRAAENSEAVLSYYESAVKKQNAENWFGAVEDFKLALSLNPSFSDAWFRLSQVTYELEDFELCVLYLDEAEKYARNNTDIQILRGMCFISLGRISEAEKIFTDIIARYPNNIEARFGLAELDLYEGRYSGAQKLYTEALERNPASRKALLSLAILASENKNYTGADSYIHQALRYHSGDSRVHYLSSYLSAREGKLSDAEKSARAAVQIDPDFSDAYMLLASILYAEKKYEETVDICDYLIERKRNFSSAWYLKGLSQFRLGQNSKAEETLFEAVQIDPEDEITRAFLELLIEDKKSEFPQEKRRLLAEYHLTSARSLAKLYRGEESRYEYQRALKIDSENLQTRFEFAQSMNALGLSEFYLNQLKFIQSSAISKNDEESKSLADKISDSVESYDSLLKYSLSAKWNVEPFQIDKTRWNIGFFYEKKPVNLFHNDSEEIACRYAAEVFDDTASVAVQVKAEPVLNFAQAFKEARKNKQDYFVVMDFEESEREISLVATIYNGKNGIELFEVNLFRTGNNRLSSILRSFKQNLLEMLPVRGKIIARNGNRLLVDLGKTEGIVEGAVFNIIKSGTVTTNDNEAGLKFAEKNLLGTLTIDSVGEEISQATFALQGFYDRVNTGDEVLLKSLPQVESEEPARRVVQSSESEENSSGATLLSSFDIFRQPAFVNLIRRIK